MTDIGTLQFFLLAVAFVTGVMILLQATVSRRVWSGYLIGFFSSAVSFAATVMLR